MVAVAVVVAAVMAVWPKVCWLQEEETGEERCALTTPRCTFSEADVPRSGLPPSATDLALSPF